MTRSIMHKRDDPETASTSPTLINSLPLIKAVSHGVEEAVDKEKAMQEIEAERGEHPGDEGDGGKREPDVYDRFPKSKKRMILFIVSYAAFLGRESSSFLSDTFRSYGEQAQSTITIPASRNLIVLHAFHTSNRLRSLHVRGHDRLYRSHLHLHHRCRSIGLVDPERVLRPKGDLPLEHPYLRCE